MERKAISKKVIAIVAIVALASILAVCLVACNNQDTFEKRMKDKDYIVVSVTAEQLKETMGEDVGDIEWAIVATKGDMMSGEGEYVTIVKFKKEQDAKDCVEEAKKGFEELEFKGYSAERSGKVVFVGTTKAVNDAK